MVNLLIRCPECGTIYRIKYAILDENNDYIFVTDLDGKFRPNQDYSYKCMKCEKDFDVTKNAMKTDSWIADLLFKIKGS